MDCRNAQLGGLAHEPGKNDSEWRYLMILFKSRVFSGALLLAIAVMMPGLTKAQEAQPMSEISLGSGGGGFGAGTLAGTTSFGGDTTTSGAASTSGPEAVAYDGTYVWVAT